MQIPLRITDLNPEILSDRETAAFAAGYQAAAQLVGALASGDVDRMAFDRLAGRCPSEVDRLALRVDVEHTIARLRKQRERDRLNGNCLEIGLSLNLEAPAPPPTGDVT